jgi:DNA-binding CsgD family transcriptional regulator
VKSCRSLEAGSLCHPLLVFGRAPSNYMATDRNNGSNGRGAQRLSRRQLNHAQSVGESVDQFAKYVVAIYAALNSKEFINATFQLLQAATPGCFTSTMLRHIDGGALWMSSNGLRLEAETTEHFCRDHPGYHFLLEYPGTKILPTKGVLPEGEELMMSRFYWPYMLPMGWRHALGLCFWEEPSLDGLDCIFSIHRTAAQGDFTAAEIRLLETLHPLIDDARPRINKRQAERSALHSLEELVRDLPLATALLDWDLRPVYHDPAGRNECARWRLGESARAVNSDGADFKVPDDLLQICWEMKRQWCRTTRSDAHSGRIKREAHDVHQSLRAIITLISLDGAAIGKKPTFLLQFVRPSKAKAPPVAGEKNLALLAHLTPEERAVAGLVCKGKSNDDIATQLAKSIWTVKRQIYSIFRKLGLTSRTQLVMLLLPHLPTRGRDYDGEQRSHS